MNTNTKLLLHSNVSRNKFKKEKKKVANSFVATGTKSAEKSASQRQQPTTLVSKKALLTQRTTRGSEPNKMS